MEWTRQRGPKGGVYCFYDIKQAYDSCSWDILRETMIREHWGIQAVDFLMARLQLSIRVRDPGTGILSEPVDGRYSSRRTNKPNYVPGLHGPDH